ncbi:MAG: hypothetical protein KJN76_05625, partial [Eudoraea sp.]|nr:hypothetical protein [Eudoraea sp.]
MKTADKVLVTIVLLSVLACSKDDGNNTNLNDPTDPMSEAENKAPGAFTLLEVVDGATDVELFPTLTWNTATDPDGDQVVYDVYMDTDTNPETKVASDLLNTTFTLSEKLDLALDHYWKVIAKDGKGGEAQSETFRFTTRPIRATRITQEADLPPRGYHAAVVYNNALYVMNGTNDNGELSDLWVAYDLNNGFESIAVNDSDFPGLRIGQTLTVFGENGSQDSRITSIGGRQSVTFYADVSST